MFSILGNKLKIDKDSEYIIPDEIVGLQYNKIYGTATCGLRNLKGVLIKNNEVLTEYGEKIKGFNVDDTGIGYAVFIREQITIDNSTIWLFSRTPILNQLNYISVDFQDKIFKLDPFTKEYAIHTK